MKSVLISVKPEYSALIASGEKTVDVRKSKPKLDTPSQSWCYVEDKNEYRPLNVKGGGASEKGSAD